MTPPDFTGRQLGGRYSLVRRIGFGGMATVYEALDRQIDKRVAVKVLNPQFSQFKEYMARFRQEARSAARIRHPHLVDVTDQGCTDDGIAYFVMELLDGESLGDRIHDLRGPMPWEQVVAITTQVCEALAHAHAQGIVHRDVKPGNVFLVAQPGRPESVFVKLLDLGIAKVLPGMSDDPSGVPHTRHSQGVPGTPEYMSPEAAQGNELDARADIYAVGVMMYRLLTGHLPFYSPKSAFEVLRMHVDLMPVPLRQLCPEAEIPLGIEAIVLRALAKQADDRFSSARELADALRAAQQGEQARLYSMATGEDRTTQYYRAPPRPPSPALRRLYLASIGLGGCITSAAMFVLLMLVDIPSVFAGGASPPRIDAQPPEEVAVILPKVEPEPPPAEPVAVVAAPEVAGGVGKPEVARPAEVEAPVVPPEPPVKAAETALEGDPGAKDRSTEVAAPPPPKDPRAVVAQALQRKKAAIARECKAIVAETVQAQVVVELGKTAVRQVTIGRSSRPAMCVQKALLQVKLPRTSGSGVVTVPLTLSL